MFSVKYFLNLSIILSLLSHPLYASGKRPLDPNEGEKNLSPRASIEMPPQKKQRVGTPVTSNKSEPTPDQEMDPYVSKKISIHELMKLLSQKISIKEFMKAKEKNEAVPGREPLDLIHVTQLRKVMNDLDRPLTGKGVGVIVIDAGFESHHEFSENIAFQKTMTWKGKPNYHGTHVSGIIGGRTYGVAPEVQLSLIAINQNANILHVNVPLAVVHSYLRDLTYALETAAKIPGDIVNISMRLANGVIPDEVKQALIKVAQSGKSIFVSSGNKSLSLGSNPHTKSLVKISESPEIQGSMVLVGNLQNDETLSPKSNTAGASKKFISAPGTNILSSAQWKYIKLSGTSMASPSVAGVAALIKEAFPTLSPSEINDLLFESARKTSHKGKNYDPEFGHGCVDALAAIQLGLSKGFTLKKEDKEAPHPLAKYIDGSEQPTDPEDLFILGGLYSNSYGRTDIYPSKDKRKDRNLPKVKIDEELGQKYLEEAADKGHKGAQYAVGVGFAGSGQSIKALKYLDLAAQQGHSQASYELGKIFYYGEDEGEVVTKDIVKAIHYFDEAARGGIENAHAYLGDMFSDGLNINGSMIFPPDHVKAFNHYFKCAEQSFVETYLKDGNTNELLMPSVRLAPNDKPFYHRDIQSMIYDLLSSWPVNSQGIDKTDENILNSEKEAVLNHFTRKMIALSTSMMTQNDKALLDSERNKLSFYKEAHHALTVLSNFKLLKKITFGRDIHVVDEMRDLEKNLKKYMDLKQIEKYDTDNEIAYGRIPLLDENHFFLTLGNENLKMADEFLKAMESLQKLVSHYKDKAETLNETLKTSQNESPLFKETLSRKSQRASSKHLFFLKFEQAIKDWVQNGQPRKRHVTRIKNSFELPYLGPEMRF